MSWDERGRWLHGEPVKPRPSPEIASLSDEELYAKKNVAEDWLRDNFDHPKYAQALSRYEHICDELEVRRIKHAFI